MKRVLLALLLLTVSCSAGVGEQERTTPTYATDSRAPTLPIVGSESPRPPTRASRSYARPWIAFVPKAAPAVKAQPPVRRKVQVQVRKVQRSRSLGGDFARLRFCESGGHGGYRANTGNGFYGAYQFEMPTWRGLGFSGRPDLASPATQDRAAALLQSKRGWQPWPGCRKKLGFR